MLPSGSNVVEDMPLNRPCFRAKSMPACAQFPAAGISVKRLPGQFAPPSQGVSPVFGMTSRALGSAARAGEGALAVRVLRCGHRHAPGVPAVTQRVRPGIAVGIAAGRAGVQRVALLRARRRDDRGNIGVLMLLFRDLGVFTAPVAAETLLMLQAGLLLRRLTVDDPDEFMWLECLVRLPAIAAGAAVPIRVVSTRS